MLLLSTDIADVLITSNVQKLSLQLNALNPPKSYDLKYPTQRKTKHTLQTPTNYTFSFMELGSWNRNCCLVWGHAGAEQEFSHACLVEDGVRRNSKILESRRKNCNELRRVLKFLQIDAVNDVWDYTGQQTKWSHVVLVLVVVKETGFGTASENQPNCLEEPGLQKSLLFNKVLS